jgi:hypothetical protein
MARTAAHREKRTRWTPEQAKVVLAELERSGLPLRTFAARRGIDAERLYRWRTRFSRTSVRSMARVSSPGFTEITVSGTPVAQYRALGNGFEIVLTNGALVRVGPSFEPEALRHVLAIVAETGR